MKTQLIFKYIGMGIIAMLLAMCEAGVTPTDISTYTFSYETTPQGTATTLSPTWNEDIANTTYEISHSAVGTVIAPTIDTSTGTVTIATDTTAGSYTITATGSGSYSGTATAKVYVTVAPAPDPSADSTSPDPEVQDRATGKTALATEINAGIATWGNEGDFNYIITTAITDMSKLFYDTDTSDGTGYQLFNGDIRKWDTSKVTKMPTMFANATAFNQSIGDWNTSEVTDMDAMFANATAFNQPIGDWNTSAVTTMTSMFRGATAFNQPIGDWNTSAVRGIDAMFDGTTQFNQNIDNWNVGAVDNGRANGIFTDSGMKRDPCWYNSDGNGGNGAIINPRPADCSVAD